MRDLVYYIATTIDGRIAAPDGDTGFLNTQFDTAAALFDRYPETCPAHMREIFQISAPSARFDTVIMGRNTHQAAIDAGFSSAYPHLRQLVATNRELPSDPTVEQISGDIRKLVAKLKQQPGSDIWLCGGANAAAQLMELVDEVQIKVNPVLAGEGIPLFASGFAPSHWRHVSSEPVPGDVTILTYRRPE